MFAQELNGGDLCVLTAATYRQLPRLLLVRVPKGDIA